MNITQQNINIILNKYISIVDNICEGNQYHTNIKHLLYLIIPSFIIKYGLTNEKLILRCFSETKIYVRNNKEKNVMAFFGRNILFSSNEYILEKYVVINEYNTVNYIDLLDSIIHEFNHAINSINNEMNIDGDYIYLRTGISSIKYSKNNISNPINKDINSSLEEIINTKQTEEIMDILMNFNNYEIENGEFKNILFNLRREIDINGYKSNAYLLESNICKELIKNRTFISTIEKFRYSGEVRYINEWFDNIVGKQGKFNELCILLNDIYILEEKYAYSRLFKRNKINKIRKKINEINLIINKFNINNIVN